MGVAHYYASKIIFLTDFFVFYPIKTIVYILKLDI